MIEITPVQARILACLIEKEATVPETYPLTLNSLKNACNQKSNRNPVMNLEGGEILHALNKFNENEFVSIESGGKAFRYRHRFHKILEVDRSFLAIIAVLILRSSQTLNEIYTRGSRIFAFESQVEVQNILLKMIDEKFITMLPKESGKREVRYVHNLCGFVEIAEEIKQSASPMEVKVQKLEDRIDYLQDSLDDLIDIVENLRNKK